MGLEGDAAWRAWKLFFVTVTLWFATVMGGGYLATHDPVALLILFIGSAMLSAIHLWVYCDWKRGELRF